ncbi:mechanosensitive ion channel family protein [Phenylobacterium sp.]|uniref:mechanosensitive ion channel family protein n=1 Tax=Phenylobacterium sp. TaxID=1871053 RepID=UPI0030F3C11E
MSPLAPPPPANAADAVMDAARGMASGFTAMIPLLTAGLVVFLIFWATATGVRGAVENLARRRSEFPSAATAFSRLAYIVLMLLGVMIAVTVAFPSVTPAKLFSALGIGGVAIGFAFKDILQNFLAGILLLIRHPFRAGDEITTGDFTGTVESIETRATYIRTYDGQRIIVPNSVIYTEVVTVITAYDLLRSHYDVGIGYGDEVSSASKIALDAVKAVEGVLATPEPDVLLWDLAGSSKNLRVSWWTRPTRPHVTVVRSRVLQALAEALSGAGFDLPFPTQMVLFHDQTEDADGDRTRQREGWPASQSSPGRGSAGSAARRLPVKRDK